MYIKIQTRFLIIISIFAVLFLGGLLLSWYAERNRDLELLTERQIEKGILLERINELMGTTLATFAYDYSYWDEMYDFVDRRDPEWARVNIDEGMSTYNAQAVWVFDSDCRRIYSVNAHDDSTLKEFPLTAVELNSLMSRTPFSHFFVRCGIRLFEMRSAPIQPSSDNDRVTEPRGYLFVGRLWSSQYVRELASLTDSRIRVIPGESATAASRLDLERFRVVNTLPLSAWNGQRIATVAAVTKFPSMKASYHKMRAQFYATLFFVLAVMTGISFFLFSKVTHPLNLISKSLESQNPSPLARLQSCGTEFAKVTGLIVEFFRQRERLRREIEHRVQSEIALRDSEKRYHDLVDLLPLAVFETDETGRILFSNRALSSLLKVNSGKWEDGVNLLDLVSPEDHAQVRAGIQRVMANKMNPEPLEIRGLRPDGTTPCLLVDAVPIVRDERISGMLGFAMDISEQKAAMTALQSGNELLKATIESTGDGILVVDKAGKVIRCNARFAELWRIPPELIEERDTSKIRIFVKDQLVNPEEFLDKIRQLYQSADCSMDTLCFKDGRVFDRYSSPLMLNGAVVGRVWNFRDMTKYKQAEAELLRANTLLETIIATAPLPISTFDMDGRIGDVWNPAAEKMLGWSKAEVKGRMNPSVASEHWDDFRRSLEEFKDGKAVYDKEVMPLTRDGTLLSASYFGTPLCDAQGRVTGGLVILVDQTERKRAEVALRESEERFRNLSDTVPVLIWMAGVDRHCYYFNKTWLKFTGRSLQQEYGKGWLDGVHPEDRTNCLNAYRSAFASRRPFSIEFRLRGAAGIYHWVLDRGAPRFTADGSFAGYIGTCTDISERRAAEEAMRESEERFRAIFETAHDAIFIRDRDLVYTHVNPGSDKFLGLSPAQVIGKTNKEIYGEEIARQTDQSDHRVLRGETTEEEFTHVIKGVPTTFHLIKVPIRDTRGSITGICGIARDISERKRNEEALKESEARLRAIFEGARDPIFIKDLDRRYVHVNQAMADSCSVTMSGIIGLTDDDLLDPKVAEDILRNDLQVLAGETVVQEVNAEMHGKPVTFSVIKVPLRGSGNNIIGLVGIARDITDRKCVEQQIGEWNRRYEMVVASSGQVVYDEDLLSGVIHWSDSVQKVLGYTEHEILETNDLWLERIHTDDRPAVQRQLDAAKKNRGSFDIHYRYRHQQGHYIWIRDRGFFVANAEGEYVRALGMMHDVTEQRQAEDALRQSRERYRALVDSSDDFIYSYDLTGRFTSVNASLCRAMGLAKERFIGKTHLELGFPPDVVREWEELHQRVIAANEVVRAATSTPMPDGNMRWYDVMLSPIRDASGVIIGIAGISRDVTDLRLAEEAAREKAQAYRLIAEHLQDVVWRMDANMRFTYCSPSIIRWLGYTVDEALRLSLREVLTPDSLERAVAMITGVLEGKTQGFELALADYEHIRKDGSTVWGEVASVPIFDDAGKIKGLIGITRDITGRLETERILRDAAQSAQSIVEAAPLPMIVMRLADRQVILANEPLRRVLGLGEADPVDFPLMSHFDNEEHRRMMTEQLQRDGYIHGMQVNFRHSDGSSVTLIGSANLFQMNGEPCVIAMAVPVSDTANQQTKTTDDNPAAISHHLETLYGEIRDSLDRVRHHVKFPEDQDKWKT